MTPKDMVEKQNGKYKIKQFKVEQDDEQGIQKVGGEDTHTHYSQLVVINIINLKIIRC